MDYVYRWSGFPQRIAFHLQNIAERNALRTCSYYSTDGKQCGRHIFYNQIQILKYFRDSINEKECVNQNMLWPAIH